ncbi:hypothetical protein [Mycobacterium sp. 1423905.2]|uniref:hypothetical protein n=1 Tax=Mycobacterium sp. 1423905.2 TaxID=1856859 RepID=UPI00080217C3|nr:hypothetical protein [Mycobacterium sp. 1423905.2]OBJ62792.1 hypothetical protein A9W95_07920 [Mycobacterium sp. 1423905.2]
MAYTPNLPLTHNSDALRARIPGWGADLDPRDRPSFPKLQENAPPATGAHWQFPERQPEKWPRERSIEHKFLTPVFGTSSPPKGLSGVIRKYAYRKYSEGRAAHWLLLIAADRVDAIESHLTSLVTGHPDNPLTETGIRSELTHHGYRSRVGTKRVDLAHTWIDPILIGAPWIVPGVVAVWAARARRRSGDDA